MNFIGNRSVGSDLPDGYYMEYGIFDDSKNIWITKKDGDDDQLFVCLASCVSVDNEYNDDGDIIAEKGRRYDALVIEEHNPPRVLTFILEGASADPEEAESRLLFELTSEEVSVHILMDMV